jgi:UDP-N-acetylglucosamine acyltransferase
MLRPFLQSCTNLARRYHSPNIHPSSVVHPSASIHPSVKIGPFCVIGEHATIGPYCDLKSHVVVEGHTNIGARSHLFSHAVVGTKSQDKKDTGLSTVTNIGTDCTIREFVSINRGTIHDTTIGSHVHLLANVHIGHDCTVEDRVVISNGSCLAGHVKVGRGAIIGGLCGIKQRVRIGQLAMIGGASAVDFDVIPYGLVMGNRALLRGINLVGLKRDGVASRKEISFLLSSQRYLYGDQTSGSSFAPKLNLPFHTLFNDRKNELLSAIEADGSNNTRTECAKDFVSQSKLCREVLQFLEG